MEYSHVSVLLAETVEALNLKAGDVVVDSTLGGGGHAMAVYKRVQPTGKLVGIDRDISAIQNFPATDRVQLAHANYCEIDRVLDEFGVDKVDAIVADLGLSSHQIDTAERGFSYMNDAPLDMRMNASEDAKTAYDVVNTMSEKVLANLIYELGDERYSRQIAANIVRSRPIKTTGELSQICVESVPVSYFKFFGHPAKKTFQAIRMLVNRELESLEKFLEFAPQRLKVGGRIAIITFHSGEDRLVKHEFKRMATDCLCPPKSPKCICGHKATMRLVTKKPITPGREELKANPRSASAKLRVAEKI